MNKTKLSPPWFGFSGALKAMFEKDPEVTVKYDEDNYEIKLLVANTRKADALSKLLPKEKVFGNVVMTITIVPANEEETPEKLFREAFAGNGAVSEIWSTTEAFMSNPITYVIFTKEVVQYFNDDLGDAHGNRSTLYQELAKEIFGNIGGVFYCTDNK